MNKYKVRIQNFQSIRDASLDISGLTVLYSPKSNVGKSSVVRALQAVLFGRFFKGMVQDGTKSTKVTFGLGDEHVITYQKGDAINACTIDGVTYDKLGQNYPSEVQKFGFKNINLEGLEIQLQIREQFDKAFPMNLSAPELGKVMSRIVDLSQMNETIKRALSDRTKLTNLKSIVQNQMTDVESKLAYIDVDKLTELAFRVTKIDQLVSGFQLLTELKELKGKLDVLRVEQKSLDRIPAFTYKLKFSMSETIRQWIELQALTMQYKKLQKPDFNIRIPVSLKDRIDIHNIAYILQELQELQTHVKAGEKIQTEKTINVHHLEGCKGEIQLIGGILQCPTCGGSGVVMESKVNA